MDDDELEEILPTPKAPSLPSIDEAFPIRTINNEPSYRSNQKEVIQQIISPSDSKFVALEGPVGCGKSAINYTAGRCIGRTIYLTPLTMLQDQIAHEGWPEMRMVKGRSKYMCNYADEPCNCAYSDEKIKMCRSASERKTSRYDINKIASSVNNIHIKYRGDKYNLGMRTSFSSSADVHEKMREIASSILKTTQGMSYEEAFDTAVGKMACLMSDRECPVRSSRLLAQYAGVVVMNPDILFLMNRNINSPYRNASCLVYDECQQIETVIQRMFKASIQIDTLKGMFGIDLLSIFNNDKQASIIAELKTLVNTTIAPLLAACKIIKRTGSLASVRDLVTSQVKTNATLYGNTFIGCCSNHFRQYPNDEISFLKIINHAFTNLALPSNLTHFKSFIELAREDFEGKCDSYGCSNVIDISCVVSTAEKLWGTKRLEDELKHLKPSGKQLNRDYDESLQTPSKDLVYAHHISLLVQIVEEFVTAFGVLKAEDSNDFLIDKKEVKTEIALSGMKTLLAQADRLLPYGRHYEKCLELIPINIGKIMHRFFYSVADKVILSSGTWVSMQSLYHTYGLPNDTVHIKVPSTFDKSRRKVFVLDSPSCMNFSEKTDDNKYFYKTLEGINLYTSQLRNLLSRVRGALKGFNANAVVHCHTFEIAATIAENMEGVDDSFLIHGAWGKKSINRHTGLVIPNMDKDDLINMLKNNPNSGLTAISPSLSEGIDLKGDIARMQVILKMPIPNLGDKYVKIMTYGDLLLGVDKTPNYIDRITFTTIAQQYGRIMRAPDDWGVTVVMDQQLTRMIKQLLKSAPLRKDLNMEYFFEGIQMGKDGFLFPF